MYAGDQASIHIEKLLQTGWNKQTNKKNI